MKGRIKIPGIIGIGVAFGIVLRNHDKPMDLGNGIEAVSIAISTATPIPIPIPTQGVDLSPRAWWGTPKPRLPGAVDYGKVRVSEFGVSEAPPHNKLFFALP